MNNLEQPSTIQATTLAAVTGGTSEGNWCGASVAGPAGAGAAIGYLFGAGQHIGEQHHFRKSAPAMLTGMGIGLVAGAGAIAYNCL